MRTIHRTNRGAYRAHICSYRPHICPYLTHICPFTITSHFVCRRSVARVCPR